MHPQLKSALKRRAYETIAILLVMAVSAFLIYRVVKPLDAAACIGRPESEIITHLGSPSTRFPGNYGAPSITVTAGHAHMETLTWQRLTGTLYVSTSDESGKRVCFRAGWLPAGGEY